MTGWRLALSLVMGACAVDPSGLPFDPDAGLADLSTDLDLAGRDMPTADTGPDADGVPDASDACAIDGRAECSAGAVRECEGGVWVPRETCALGCGTDGTRCAVIDVSHVDDDTLLSMGTVPLTGSGPILIDTDTGAITVDDAPLRGPGEGEIDGILFLVQSQPTPGPELGIFVLSEIALGSSSELKARGRRALVLLAAGDVTLEGVIDVGAEARVAGPGGGTGGERRQGGGDPGGGQEGDVDGLFGGKTSGGGGGGHVLEGGDGGDEEGAVGGAGGPVISDPEGMPLVGGGGGAGGGSVDRGGRGGGGGGAIQITAGGTLRVVGTVRAPGDGGSHSDEGGGGGGAGGTIFLEAPELLIAGTLAANGGGGAGGGRDGEHGARGMDDTTLAAGGDGSRNGGGGNGGADGLLAGFDGQDGDPGGGGGGAAGRVVLRGRSVTTGVITVAGPALTRAPLRVQ